MPDEAPISTLLSTALATALQTLPEVMERWRRASFRVSSASADLLDWAVQREGRTDVLLRCMEDEYAVARSAGREPELLTATQLQTFSIYWIGGCYEILAALRRRKTENSQPFLALLRDFELLRVGLEKHQIPKDRGMRGRVELTRYPPMEGDTSVVYDPASDARSHIMPCAMTERGSLEWMVIDGATMEQRWIGRRDLSDRLLNLWSTH